MYIQITNKCNMNCAHCCFSCGSNGIDMSIKTYKKALKLCEEYDSPPFICGGEPTLHPQFEKILLLAINSASIIGEYEVGIVTNGSVKHRALMIAH